MLILLAIELIVGLVINIKKIKAVKSKKDISWELEIYHSVTLITYLTVCAFLDIMEYVCLSLSDSIVLIFQYTVPIFKEIAISIILSHSFSVALYKYYVIIHRQLLNDDNKNMTWKCLLFMLILPAIIAMLDILRIIDTVPSVPTPNGRCQSTFDKFSKGLGFCEFKGDSYYRVHWPFPYYTSQVFCVLHSILHLLLRGNLFEGFFYYKIFRYMNR